MAHKWRDIRHKFSDERLAEINREADDEAERMGFGKLRLARQRTQVALAERLNIPQTAVLLGLGEHDIPLLIAAGLLKPLGNPPVNAVKYFGTVEILELAGESAVLNKIRSTVYHYWRGKNASHDASQPKRCYLRNGKRSL